MPEPDIAPALMRRARTDAYRLLRYRPRSTQELARRLQLRGHPSAVIHALTAALTAAGQLDDRAFARLWARSRVHAHRGPRVIAQELSLRGVARPLIAETLAALRREHDEAAVARAFVERRLSRYRNDPVPAQWRKLGHQLAHRGFSADTIETVLQQCLTPHTDPR